MKLIFRLRFHTQIGQTLFITGNHKILGGGRPERAIPLQYLDTEFWQLILQLPDDEFPDALITYNYILRNADGFSVQDSGGDRVIHPPSFRQSEVLIIDSWNQVLAQLKTLFTPSLSRKSCSGQIGLKPMFLTPATPTHTFKAKAPLLLKGQVLYLSGSGPSIGQLEHQYAVFDDPDCGRKLFCSAN